MAVVVVVVVAIMRLSVCGLYNAMSYCRVKTTFNAKSFFVMDSAFISFHFFFFLFASCCLFLLSCAGEFDVAVRLARK